MSFVPQAVIDGLAEFSRSQADAQPFGVVRVTDEGIVTLYNRWESGLAGVAIETAEGRNFFTQIAPCTNNRLVFGRFKDGVQKKQLDSEFNYTFTYKMKPTNVALRLFRHEPTATNWVFVGLR